MAGLSLLHYDAMKRDFVINGQPLLAHLAMHEGISASIYQSSLGVQPRAAERFRGEADPDLADGHVALYVCGTCGDYERNIGVRVVLDDPEIVAWVGMGWHEESDGWRRFSKVRGYRFGRAHYFAALRIPVRLDQP